MGPKKQGKKRDSEAAAPPAAAAAMAPAPAAAADEKPSKKKAKAAAAAEEKPASEEENEDVSEDFSDDEGEEEDSEEDGEPSAVEVWQEQLKQRAEAMNAIVCMVGGMDKDGSEAGEDDEDEDEDEEDEITVEKLEKCTRLFLPKKTEEYLEPLSEALAEIGCTPPDSEDLEGDDEYAQHKERMAKMPEEIKALFRWQARGLVTRHSLHMQDLLKTSLKEVDKSLKAKKYDDAFCRWAATLMAANDEEHWYGDTEDDKAAEGIFKSMKKQWGQLKKLGLKDLGGPSSEGACTDPQKALDYMLESLADSMRAMEYEV